MSYIKKSECNFCGGRLSKVLNLGKIPPVNSFYPLEESLKIEKFPLILSVCEKCELLQLSTILEPQMLFEEYHYLSGASLSLVKDLKDLAEYCILKFGLGSKSKVLDIGSNDGSFLENFLGRVQRVLGVDPGKEVGRIATKKGIGTERRFFDLKSAEGIYKKYGDFDLISSLHNLANIPEINDFLKGVKLLLKPSGVLVIEVADAEKMVNEGRFDSIYHEHYNYFSLPVLKRILGAHGLLVFKVKVNNKQGGSIRVFARQAEVKKVSKERGFEAKKYVEYEKKVLLHKKELLNAISKIKGGGIVGFGAPAKGVVLANLLKLNKAKISFIVDSTEIKQNKVLPGTDIPVFAEEHLNDSSVLDVLVFAWSYEAEVVRKLKKLGRKMKVIFPFPRMKVLVINTPHPSPLPRGRGVSS